LHETRFMDMETGLPERYQSEAILKRQRDVHESLISKGLGIISDSYLDRFEKRCREEDVPCFRKSREGKNFTELIKEAEQGDYDLIVMGGLGIGAAAHSLIGSVAERVARKTRKDILIIKTQIKSPLNPPFARGGHGGILVAIDGSPYSYWGLMAAIGLKKVFNADIEAVSAFDPYFHQVAFRNIADALSEDAAKVFRFKEQEKLHDEIIDKGMAKLYQGYLDTAEKIAKARGAEIKTTLLAGKAYNEILNHIQHTKPALLMLGHFGVHQVEESDIGSNTENILRLAPCSVFIAGKGYEPDDVVGTDASGDRIEFCPQWTEEALKRLERVPSFAKGMAKKAIEDYAREEVKGKRSFVGQPIRVAYAGLNLCPAMLQILYERRDLMKGFFKALLITAVILIPSGILYAYDEMDVKDGGQIIGHVKFVGNPPKFAPIKVNKNEDFCGNEKPSEVLVVGKDGGVKFAVGYLEKVEKGKAIERVKQTDLDQKKCVFTPHVTTIVKGTDLATTNSDTVLHNANMEVKELGEGDEKQGIQMFNFGQPKQNQVYVKKVRKLGQVKVTCDSHTHMRGYVLAFDHPYHAVSDETGSFVIDNIPPGKYTLKVWHESWKLTGHDSDGRPLYAQPILLTKEVDVPAKGIVHVNFELK
ncbi:MAG: universal stress protein, partial [Deltaproteobacteria bacterium]|nr:universal stress protein [Deltaproteobacteria bacterium]